MAEFLQQYLGIFLTALITGGVGGFFGWFYERKRKKVEVDNLEAEGSKAKADYSKSIIDLYQEALTDLKNQYEARYLFLKNEYDLKFENQNLKIEKLTKDQEMWRNKYTALKKEFDAYKRKHP
ncbi:hypothetical protein ML462_14095 [Gramella lutea]|uniref:Uncharacterized protein n=1 Tax=Christiangramia lutea TaxID=1607951 RepID=A0A9X1V8C5_9FLAO|nr:hypothetical protein [Christiangramia lutea]MCH4824303.1 hypothetical protein [Christiangramia lutea]